MKKTFRKILSLMMAAVLLFTIFPYVGLQLKASAGTNGHSQSDAETWARAQVQNPTDYDGSYGVQCVDLIEMYYVYLGYSRVAGNGCDYATNSIPCSSWQRISYYSGFVPRKGDVAVWTYTTSAYGHVAIVLSADSNGMTVAEFLGSTHKGRIATYNYSYGTLKCFIRPDFSNAQSGSSQGATGATSKVYVGNNIAYFSWNEDPNAEYYHVRIWKKENGTEVTGQYDVWNFSEGLSTSVVLPNGQYRAYIHACGPNYSSKKEDLNFTVVKESPMITVSSYRLTTTLSWPTVSGATHYEVNIYKDKLWATGKLAVQEGNLTSTSYTTTLPVGNYQSYINYYDSSGKLIQQTAAECFSVNENVYAFTENNVIYISWNEDAKANYYNIEINNVENGEITSLASQMRGVTGTDTYTVLRPGDYAIHLDAIEDNNTLQSNYLYFTVTLKNPILSSTVSDGKVFLSWTSYPNVHHYSLTVFKDRIWVGSAVFDSNQVYGQSIELDLPEGTYQAYVNPLDVNNNRLLAYSGSVETFTINHSHQYTSIIKKEATCSEDGLKESTCSSCGNVYTEIIPALGHNYQRTVTAPTCSEKGFTTYKCSRCGDTYISDYTDTIPHQSATWYTVNNPTTTADGLAEKRCDYCGEILDSFIIPCLNPDYVTGITLSSTNEVVGKGDVITLIATVNPETAQNKNVVWTSMNTKVAAVSNGIVTAIKPGAAAIVAQTEDGGYKDVCFVRVISLTGINGTVVDNENGLIYGLSAHLDSVEDYIELVDDSMSLQLSTSAVGTDTTINVVDNGEIIDSYEAVIFGDVNGDGWYDGMDAMIVSCLVNGMLTKDDVGEAVYMAADCNHDGVIDQLDVELLQQAGVLLADVDQTKSAEELLETSSAYAEYLNLIDQTVETAEDDTAKTVEETPAEKEPVSSNWFRMIVSFLKMLLNFVYGLFTL